MANPALVLFVMGFVAAPLLGAVLFQLPNSLGALIGLALAVFLASALALYLQERSTLASLAALWTGWVLAVVMVAQALRRRLPGAANSRWTKRGALLACALPWFGLALAQMMD